MFRSKGNFFSFVVIFLGLGMTVWWMYSTEENVLTKTHKGPISEVVTQGPRTPATALVDNTDTPLSPIAKVRKLAELQEILDSKNDNDPRLDTDFKTLSEAEKKALQEKYLAYTPEKLNERGTLVFLLGRNIENEKDLKFMEYVLNEKPCLSMANCAVPGPKAVGAAAHSASVDAITLAYPQVVTIKSIERNLLTKETLSPALKALAIKNLEGATHSPSPVVANLAALTLKKVSP